MKPQRTHLTIQEVAERWNVSPTFVRRAIWARQLRATKFGRTIRVPIAEADRYAKDQTQTLC